jgi:tripartite-type tricarboxylate transporter receptor subunit TctC
MTMRAFAACTATFVAVMAMLPQATHAQTVAEFYKGRQINLYIGYSAGGAYDLYARLIARHMGRHVPGNPSIVPQNIAGGGSLRAANFTYQVAPKDGTAFATIGRSVPLAPLFGHSGTQFDPRRYTWLGSANDEVTVCAAWHTSGFRTFEDMRRREMTSGGTGQTDEAAQIVKGLNVFLGTKIKAVSGYPGGNEINLAIERGEIDGRCALSWSSVRPTRPQWIEQKLINVLIQVSFNKHPELPEVPLILDLAPDDDARQVLRFLAAQQVLGRPFLAPPDVPAERATALRRAFMDTLRDPEFLAEARRAALEITPVPGERIEALLGELYTTPPDVLKKAAALFN